MATKHKGKGVVRSVKNFTKGYSDIEIKVRDVTSNDPYGPSSRLMAEISAASNNQYMFMEIMNILDKRLNDKGKNWRHVYKALVVVDYLLHSGSEQVMSYITKNMFIIKTLQQFQYVDEHGKDQGATVRSMAKDIVYLIDTPEKLQEERRDGSHLRYQSPLGLSGAADASGVRSRSYSADDLATKGSAGAARSRHSFSTDQEERDLQRAIEESKRLAITEQDRLKQSEEELKLALELSKAAADSLHQNARATQSDTNFASSQTERRPMDDLMDLFEGPPAHVAPHQADYGSFYQIADPSHLSAYPAYYGALNASQGSSELFSTMSDPYTSPVSQPSCYPSYNGSNVSVGTNASSMPASLLGMSQSYSQPNIYAQALVSASSSSYAANPPAIIDSSISKPAAGQGVGRGWSAQVTDQSNGSRRPGERDPFADLAKAVPELSRSTPSFSHPHLQHVPIGSLAVQGAPLPGRRDSSDHSSAQSRSLMIKSTGYSPDESLLSFDATALQQPYHAPPLMALAAQPYDAEAIAPPNAPSYATAGSSYYAGGGMASTGGYAQTLPKPVQSAAAMVAAGQQPSYVIMQQGNSASADPLNPYPMRPPYQNQPPNHGSYMGNSFF